MTDTDIPFPAQAPKARAAPTPAPAPLTVAGFHADARAAIDARKAHLARVGIGPAPPVEGPAPLAPTFALPGHAEVLRMPEPLEAARPPSLAAGHEPGGEAPAAYAPKRLPHLPGVHGHADKDPEV